MGTCFSGAVVVLPLRKGTMRAFIQIGYLGKWQGTLPTCIHF